jgi:phosphoglycolate phosphatase-like HAD superfamily hydrolase
MRCYIFDIDGTLADASHRMHFIQGPEKNWDAFFAACVDDKPHEHICELALQLSYLQDAWVIFVSGRSDQVRIQTRDWLFKYVYKTKYNGDLIRLYMRKHGDHRPDHVVKLELLEKLRNNGWRPIMAFDDRDQVVRMWRNAGVPCAQVAEGDF